MASKMIKNALKDVMPMHEGDFPSSLIEHVERLFSLSSKKMVLKPQEEIARYHLCAIIGAEQFQKSLNLTDPVVDRVPVAPTTAKSLLKEMKHILFNSKSRSGTPSASRPPTPRKVGTTNLSTPVKNQKEPQSMAATPLSSARKKLFSDPGTPNSESPSKKGRGRPAGASNRTSSPSTPNADSPSKRGRGRPPGALNRTTLEAIGQSPFQTASTIKTLTPFLSPNKKVYLSTPEVITFCNKFQLPADVTAKVLHTFSEYHNRIKHEWALLCGLVALVYNIINHDVLNNKAGAKQEFFLRLHHAQNGALLKQSLKEWINLINEFFKDTKWVKQLKFEYGYYSHSNLHIPSMGNMLTVNAIFMREEDYQQWKEASCAMPQNHRASKRSRAS